MKQRINEVEIWDQMRNGDQNAFNSLYQYFIQPLYSYSMGICTDKDLVKDCLHDLFVEIWKNHATLGPTTSVRYYLMASIKRKLVRHLEGNLRNQTHHLNYMRDYVEDLPSQEQVMIHEEVEILGNKQLIKGMKLLSRRQREAIQLKYFQNLDTDQISESMRINHQSVYNLIFGALRVMKEGMTNKSFAI